MTKSENRAHLIQQVTPQHSEFVIKTKDDYTGTPYEATFTSNFDSGNLHSLNLPSDKPNHVNIFCYFMLKITLVYILPISRL